MKIYKKISLALLSLSVLGTTACKKTFLERRPTDQASADEVFKTIEGARAAVQGLNRLMYTVDDTQLFGYLSIALTKDLMGEDMPLSDIGSGWFVLEYRYTAARSPTDNGSYTWTYFYKFINNANLILANIDNIVADQGQKDMVKAQALTYRAWAYYNLCLLYQHTYKGSVTGPGTKWPGPVENAPAVPLYTQPTQVGNPRATMKEVFTQITSDLKSAVTLFDGSGLDRTAKSEINGQVARGIYARVALEMQDWPTAATMAHDARQGFTYMNASTINSGMNSLGNAEWIWGAAINAEQGGIYASYIAHMDENLFYGNNQQKMINKQLYNNFIDATDSRKAWWTAPADAGGNYLAYSQQKFKAITPGSFLADFPFMRASEMALVESEALAQQGNVSGGAAVLQEYMQTRMPTYVAPTASSDTLIKAIWLERRIELWGEGFRYSDIKRQSATFDAVDVDVNAIGLKRSSAQGHKAGIASLMTAGQYSPQFLFRIPSSEFSSNKALATEDQNP